MSERILLHSCCAPCSAPILEWLLNNDYEPVVFFFNPNIFPEEEYELRKNECIRYCQQLNVTYYDDDYLHEAWRESIAGLENEPERGERCLACFGVRLMASAKKAHILGIRRFTTTLAGSRWKRLDQIKAAGLLAQAAYPDTQFWEQNWRKGGLQERRGILLKENHFYNQLYCGCEFSMGHLRDQPKENLPPWVKKVLEI